MKMGPDMRITQRTKPIIDPWIPRPTFPRTKFTQDTLSASSPLRWTVDDQGWAVQQGLYISECLRTQRAILIALPNNTHGWTTEDPKPILNHIEHMAFLYRLGGDHARYEKLRTFIQSQDQTRSLGAWDAVLVPRDTNLIWYKRWVATQRSKRAQAAPYYGEMLRREQLRIQAIQERASATREAARLRRLTEAFTTPKSPSTQAILERALKRETGRRTLSQIRADELREAQDRQRQADQRDAWRRAKRKRQLAMARRKAQYANPAPTDA